jgi:hypothetical protein
MDEELIDQDLRAGARPRRAPVRENRGRSIANLIVSHVVTFRFPFSLPFLLTAALRSNTRRSSALGNYTYPFDLAAMLSSNR